MSSEHTAGNEIWSASAHQAMFPAPAGARLLAVSGVGPVAISRLQLGRDVLHRRLAAQAWYAETAPRQRSRHPSAQGWPRRRDVANSPLGWRRVSTHGRRRR
jgi:hypothetical protein